MYAPFGGIGGRRLSKKKNLFPAVEKKNISADFLFLFLFLFFGKKQKSLICVDRSKLVLVVASVIYESDNDPFLQLRQTSSFQ